MKEKLMQGMRAFLEQQGAGRRPLLVGYSGGPDSAALVDLLHTCRMNIHLAHVDHGWRAESEEQACALAKHAEGLGIPFHLRKIDVQKPGNAEDEARKQRLAFFEKIYQEIDAQALVLGHQADDQAETVLKRIFEGADLHALGGIKAVSHYQSMNVWRPLLSITKKELLEHLEKRDLSYIDDATNRDPAFLRARMRVQILPELAQMFGKKISSNLSKLGSCVHDINHYLDRRTEPFWRTLTHEEGKLVWDFTPFHPFEKLELQAFLRRLAKKEGMTLSAAAFGTLADLILTGASGKRILAKDHEFVVERGRLLVVSYRR